MLGGGRWPEIAEIDLQGAQWALTTGATNCADGQRKPQTTHEDRNFFVYDTTRHRQKKLMRSLRRGCHIQVTCSYLRASL